MISYYDNFLGMQFVLSLLDRTFRISKLLMTLLLQIENAESDNI